MLARQRTHSARMCSSKLASSPVRPYAAAVKPLRQTRRLQRHHAIEEKRDTAGSEASSSPDTLSQEQLAKLAELRRQRADAAPQMNSNVVAGAIEEAQLISWPTPGKALLDTVLVLAIVSVSGSTLFTLNVLLADASNWWYSH
eukprot:GHUV01004396.1.p1 GENE.GHUV01004396.1~~GHUV01004396.1.p1  ORF type:complete len:143 (+),score=24.27 GHUV01004396.1:157-585(+)